MKIKGNDIIVYEGGVAMAASRSCDIQASCDLREISSPLSGEYRDYVPGRKTWMVTVNKFVVAATGTDGGVRGMVLKVGDKVRLTFGVRDANGVLSGDRLTGYAICKEARVTGTRGNMAQGSWVFQGCGLVERVMVRLRDSLQTPLNDKDGLHLRAMEALSNLT